jgi:purine-nucleoside phosphorylase
MPPLPREANFRQLLDRVSRQPPRVAVVLGSGLGDLVEHVRCLEQVPFADVPGLEPPTVRGHQGKLILGTWAGQMVLLFSGRLHFYEGHSWQSAVEPIRIARDLGVRVLLLTNAAGGIRDDLVPGSLLNLNAHLQWPSPCLHRPYDARLHALLDESASALGMTLPTGTYAQVTGPCYETPAEIRALKTLGVDAVGMSTAREAETAVELGLACTALSCITNRAAGLGPGRILHDEVLSINSRSRERIGALLDGFLQRL